MKSADAVFGLVMLAASAVGFLAVGDAQFGSASEPGGAFFPYAASSGLAAAGLSYLVRAALAEKTSPKRRSNFALRPFFSAAAVFAGGIFFCLALRPLGLPLATAGALLAASSFSFKGASTIFAVMLLTAACTILFYYGLGMDVPLLPAGIE